MFKLKANFWYVSVFLGVISVMFIVTITLYSNVTNLKKASVRDIKYIDQVNDGLELKKVKDTKIYSSEDIEAIKSKRAKLLIDRL